MSFPDLGRLEIVFERLSEADEEVRARELAQLAREDPALHARVTALLAADRRRHTILDLPSGQEPGGLVGRRIGPYQLTGWLGDGGMGTVYRARRADGSFDQDVAVKVLARGYRDPTLRRRFQAERQIMAVLDHPGIARILDGGELEDGFPYLVMELVSGIPVDRYCDERNSDLEERIDLFLEIAEVVRFAHRNLVVHRDLKPGNILIDAEGRPRLLDFGIAKLLDDSPAAGRETTTGGRHLTPAYASPEQLAGGSLSTATDIYSLGVLLYRLLTGAVPFEELMASPAERTRALFEREPERASVRVRAADRRRARRLAGDLDNILAMALDRDPDRRYLSVEAFAADLRAYREGRPVTARPLGVFPRLAKFCRRHPVGVTAGFAAFLLISSLAVLSTIQAHRLSKQRSELVRERDKAVKVIRLVESLFKHEQLASPGAELTARELIDSAAEQVLSDLEDEPDLQAQLALTIAALYENLGEGRAARPFFDRSVELRRRTLGEDHLALAESLYAKGSHHFARGEFDLAESAFRQALAIRSRHPELDELVMAESLNGAAVIAWVRGRFEEARDLHGQVLTIYRRRHGEQHEGVATTLSNLGVLNESLGDYAAAETSHRQAIAVLATLEGPARRQLPLSLNNLAAVVSRRGRTAEAEGILDQALAAAAKVYDADDPVFALLLDNRGVYRTLLGRLQEGEADIRLALERRRLRVGPESEPFAMSLSHLGRVLYEQGRFEEARASLGQAIELQSRALGPSHPRLAEALGALVLVEGELGRPEQGHRLAEQAFELKRASLAEDHPELGESLVLLGSFETSLGKLPNAESTLRRGLALLERHQPGHWKTTWARLELVDCLAADGQLAAARDLLREAVVALDAQPGAYSLPSRRVRLLLTRHQAL